MAADQPQRHARNPHALALAFVSSIIAPFAAFAAVIFTMVATASGFLVVMPPIIFLFGLYLLFHYWIASSPTITSPRHRGFWSLSATFNALLLLANARTIINSFPSDNFHWQFTALTILALWQFAALILSIFAARFDALLIAIPQRP